MKNIGPPPWLLIFGKRFHTELVVFVFQRFHKELVVFVFPFSRVLVFESLTPETTAREIRDLHYGFSFLKNGVKTELVRLVFPFSRVFVREPLARTLYRR